MKFFKNNMPFLKNDKRDQNNFLIDIPKKEGQGEDAPPIYVKSKDGTQIVTSVFDGLGGAGSRKYEEGDICKTGAYIASRETREIVKRFFGEYIKEESLNINDEFIQKLKSGIIQKLKEKLKAQNFEESKLKSSLIRTFPTTMALGCVSKFSENAKIDLLWAGDSRVYTLTPEYGLIQLTEDDLKVESDPFENIETDSPLSNMIQLDEDFIINHRTEELNYPFFIFAATDGCFGYYSTPMHFENMLFETLFNADSIQDWKQNIVEELSIISGDDFSISLAYINKEQSSIKHIKELFKNRFDSLRKQYMGEILEIEKLYNSLKSTEQVIQKKILKADKKKKLEYESAWADYRKNNYSRFISNEQ